MVTCFFFFFLLLGRRIFNVIFSTKVITHTHVQNIHIYAYLNTYKYTCVCVCRGRTSVQYRMILLGYIIYRTFFFYYYTALNNAFLIRNYIVYISLAQLVTTRHPARQPYSFVYIIIFVAPEIFFLLVFRRFPIYLCSS